MCMHVYGACVCANVLHVSSVCMLFYFVVSVSR